MATIRLENVTKTFADRDQNDHRATNQDAENGRGDGPIAALNQVNLTIPDGQTLAILGPSGCGKSTLLRVLAGLETEYTGHVYFDNQLMDDAPAKDRHIGMVFQNYALYPHFEGRGNLSFFFKLRKATDEETDERIRITSEIMGIGFKQLLQRKPGTLSGGQQQRVAIARAIVRNPKLFLFDEPLSNLDAKLRAQTRVEIKRLLRQFQITAAYVTHDQTEAITLGDLVAVMRAGRVEQVGSFQELRVNPVNTFVASFLGTPPMNLLAGWYVAAGQLQLDDMSIPLPKQLRTTMAIGQKIIIGVHPEAAQHVADNEATSAGIHLRGTVEAVEADYARRTQLVHMRTGELTYAVIIGLDTTIFLDREIDVVFPHDALTFFDSPTTMRITEEHSR